MTKVNKLTGFIFLEWVYAHVFRFMSKKGKHSDEAADFVAAGFVTIGLTMIFSGIAFAGNALEIQLYSHLVAEYVNGAKGVKLIVGAVVLVMYIAVVVLLGPRAKSRYASLLFKQNSMWRSYFIGMGFLVSCGVIMFIGAEVGRQGI